MKLWTGFEKVELLSTSRVWVAGIENGIKLLVSFWDSDLKSGQQPQELATKYTQEFHVYWSTNMTYEFTRNFIFTGN